MDNTFPDLSGAGAPQNLQAQELAGSTPGSVPLSVPWQDDVLAFSSPADNSKPCLPPLPAPCPLPLSLLFLRQPCPTRKPSYTQPWHNRAFEPLLRARGHELLSRATTEGTRLLWLCTHGHPAPAHRPGWCRQGAQGNHCMQAGRGGQHSSPAPSPACRSLCTVPVTIYHHIYLILLIR